MIKRMKVILGIFALSLVVLTVNAQAYELASPDQWRVLNPGEQFERLTKEFSAYANYYAARRGYRFGSGAQHMIDRRFAEQAAREVMKKEPQYFEPAKKKIRENFRKLIDQMIIESKTIDKYANRQPGVIGEQTLSMAMFKLCPLWPICE
ncbi:MAG: hypothetical protein MI976_10740 [Pseudomonadales bacterium]|nr:hypothetical protein [Pseudomonadales bacterium]